MDHRVHRSGGGHALLGRTCHAAGHLLDGPRRKGALLSRQEKLASRVLDHRGGIKAIKPDTEDLDIDGDGTEKPGPGGRRRNRKRGVRNNKLKQEVARLKANAGGGGGQGRGRGRGGGGNRGGGSRGGGSGSTDVSKQYCFSFSKGFGPCAACEPGSVCKRGGRIHACHICGGAHKGKDCKQAKKEKKEEGEG